MTFGELEIHLCFCPEPSFLLGSTVSNSFYSYVYSKPLDISFRQAFASRQVMRVNTDRRHCCSCPFRSNRQTGVFSPDRFDGNNQAELPFMSYTPLIAAVKRRDQDMITMLLAKGGDITKTYKGTYAEGLLFIQRPRSFLFCVLRIFTFGERVRKQEGGVVGFLA